LLSPDLFLLLSAGFAGGIIAGILGIGGGMIYALIFTHYFKNFKSLIIPDDVLVKILVANSAFALIFVGISGSIKQFLSNNFYLKIVLRIGLGVLFGSIITTILLSYTTFYGKRQFTLFFALIMIPIILKMLFRGNNISDNKSITPKSYYLIITGVVSGIVTALSGLGGGFIMIPVLNGLFKFPMKKAVSVSLGVIAIVAIELTIYNLFFVDFSQYQLPLSKGAVVFPMVLPVAVGVTIGAPIGVKISHKLPNRILRFTFVLFCVIVITKLFVDFY
jgi:uncharacterized protein